MSEQDFKDLVHEIPDIVYRIDQEGNFVFVNDAIKDLGYSPDEVIGKHFSDILHPDDLKFVSRSSVLPLYKGEETGGDNAPKLFDERRRGDRKTKNLEIRLITKNWKDIIGSNILKSFGHSIICAEVTSSGVYDTSKEEEGIRFLGTVGIIKDVTRRKIDEAALSEMLDETKDIETIPDIMYRVDKDGNFTFISDGIRYLGYEADELIGKHFSTLLDSDSVEEASSDSVLPQYRGKKTGNLNAPKLFDERRRGHRKTKDLEVWLVKKGGKNSHGLFSAFKNATAWGEISAFAEYDSNTPKKEKEYMGTVGIIRNITDRKRTETALKKYTRHIEQSLMQKQQDIEKAQMLQKNLNSRFLPSSENINVLAYYMPQQELGGDFFDIRKIDNKIIIVMADCIGHGIEASMDATLLKSISDRHINYLASSNPSRYLSAVNSDIIKYSYQSDKFSTMLACVIDTETFEVVYSQANSENPYIISGTDIREIERPGGFHLGFDENTKFEDTHFTLQNGESLFFYSDAIIEMKKQNGDVFGTIGLETALASFGGGIQEDLMEFMEILKTEKGSFPLDDDTTLILVERISAIEREYKCESNDEIERTGQEIKYYLNRFCYSHEDISRIFIAYDELCKNAAIHGNKNDKSKSVFVSFKINFEKAELSIADEGDGFDYEKIPDPTDFTSLISSLESADDLAVARGRGIWLVRQYVDKFEYEDKGRKVKISRNRTKVQSLFQYH